MTELFDIVRCDYPLPEPDHQHQEFQTKDLSRALAHYTISADGRLLGEQLPFGLALREADGKVWKDRSVHRISGRARSKPGKTVDLEHHGDVRLYLTNSSRELVQYVVRFTHGRVESVRRLDAIAAAPVTLTALADVAETATFGHRSILRDCFGELMRLDPALADAALSTLGDTERAAQWFGQANKALAGLSPYQAASNGQRDKVLKVLNSIEHGIFG